MKLKLRDRVRRVLRYATYVMFYWMSLRVCLASVVIMNGWHRLRPDWNPWLILIDALTALILYWLLRLDEKWGS